jgi:hypothetical protein
MNKQEYISNKIKKLRSEGKTQAQSVAIALSMANNKYQGGGNINFNTLYNTPPQDFTMPDLSGYDPRTGQQLFQPTNGGVNLNPSDNSFNVENMDIFTNPEQLQRMRNNQIFNTAANNYDEDGNAINTGTQNTQYVDRLFNPYTGVNLETALFSLGRSLNYDGEQKTANTIRGGAAAGKVLLGGARTLFSGAGYQNMTDYQQNDFINRLYNSAPTYQALQEGGTVTNGQIMTGAYITDMQNPNAEIEAGEVIRNSQTGQIQEAVGAKHSEGGIPVNLPSGSEVLSDYTKIGAAKAKLFRKEFDIKVQAKDTYATVLEKYNKKIGWDDLIKDEEKLIEQVENQQEGNIQNATQTINLDYLADRLSQVQADKQEIQALQNEAFTKIFEAQEGRKPHSEEVMALSAQYNLPPERIQELMQAQQPVELPQMQGGGITDFFTPSIYAAEPYGKQNFTAGMTTAAGLQNEQEILQRLQLQNQNLPYIVRNSGIYSDNAGPFPNLNNTGAFQQGYDGYVDAVLQAIDVNPYLTEEEKAANRKTANSQKLALSNQNGSYDNIYGLETSSRTNFSLPYLTAEELKMYPDARFIGDVIAEDGTISPDYANLSPETQARILDTYKASGQNALNIGLGVIEVQDSDVEAQLGNNTETVNNTQVRYSLPNLPVDFILPPSPAAPVYRPDVALGRIDPVRISAEPNLIEADRQLQGAQQDLQGVPDSQRAAALASIMGQTQAANNQAITTAELANAQSAAQAQQFNVQQQDKQQLLNEQFAKTYEAQTFAAQANSRRDLQQYFQDLNNQQWFNFNYIDRRQLLNQGLPNFQVNGSGQFVYTDNGTLVYQQPVPQMTPEQQAQYKKSLATESGKLDARKQNRNR